MASQSVPSAWIIEGRLPNGDNVQLASYETDLFDPDQSTLRHDEGHVWAAHSIRCGYASNERAIVGGIQELATTTAGPHQGHELGLGSSKRSLRLRVQR